MNSFILRDEFPQALELNSVLYKRVCENIYKEQYRATDSIFGRRTHWNFHKQNIQEVDILISWIKDVLPEVSKKFASDEDEEDYGFDINGFEISECWGAHYNKGEGLVRHNHFPSIISFVYYVRTPKGFSPLIVDDINIDVREGQCVFFLGSQYHSVEPNKCKGRCIIAGNISYV